jgi:hypothetical protein
MVCFLILKDESGSRQDNPLFGIMPLAMSPTDNLSERRAGKAYVVQLTIIQQFQPFDQHRFFPYAKEHAEGPGPGCEAALVASERRQISF